MEKRFGLFFRGLYEFFGLHGDPVRPPRHTQVSMPSHLCAAVEDFATVCKQLKVLQPSVERFLDAPDCACAHALGECDRVPVCVRDLSLGKGASRQTYRCNRHPSRSVL